MNLHLSLDNVTTEEAAVIFTGLGTTLTKAAIVSNLGVIEKANTEYSEELKKIVDKYNVPSPAEQAPKEDAENEKAEAEVPKVANPKKAKAKKVEEQLKAEIAKEELDFDNALGQTTEQEETEKEVTKEDIQQHTQKLVKANASNKAQIIALLKSFKTDSISKLKTEDYEKFEAGLKSLDDVDLPF